jgi:hypothetical protein
MRYSQKRRPSTVKQFFALASPEERAGGSMGTLGDGFRVEIWVRMACGALPAGVHSCEKS